MDGRVCRYGRELVGGIQRVTPVANIGTFVEVGTLIPMRQFIIRLLLCLLPLQFALAANVDARLHAGSHHHHDSTSHSHEINAALTPDAPVDDESLSRSHAECGVCHFFHAVALLGTRADFKRPTCVTAIDPNGRDAHHRNAAAERPERPNWSVLV